MDVTPTWAGWPAAADHELGLFPRDDAAEYTAPSGDHLGLSSTAPVIVPPARSPPTGTPIRHPPSVRRSSSRLSRAGGGAALIAVSRVFRRLGRRPIAPCPPFTAAHRGTTPIRFGSVGDVAGVATVTVTSGPLATITVAPSPDTLAVGASRAFAAVGRDASGNAVPITPTWSVVNGGGSIDAGTGVFTAGTATGTFANTVRARAARYGTATSRVTSPP